jgi:hypothetical protein
MPQTPVIREIKNDELTLDYLASADKTSGDVVLVGTIPVVVCRDIDFSENPKGAVSPGKGEVWLMPQKAEVLSSGDVAYWDATGNPYGGTAGSGAVTGTATAYPIGTVTPLQANGTAATTNTDSYVRVMPDVAKRSATIAGAATADSVTGSDADMGLIGKAGASGAGGAVSGLGGAGDGAGNAGGAWTITGGAGYTAAGATGGAGGAVTRTGGAGGTDTNVGIGGVGGAAASVGGVGGAVTGAGTGGAGGAAGATGGVGGASSTTGTGGAGGAISGTAGAGGAATGAGTGGIGGAALIRAGAGGSAATTGTGGIGGAAGCTAGVGGAAGAGGTGAAGGAANLTSGVGGAAGTTGTGGAAGAVDVIGGAGGATASGTGGAGSSVSITAGAGGAASGAGTGGAAGSVVITSGTGGTHSGGTAGKSGSIRLVGPVVRQQGNPGTETNTATTTAAKILTGILAVTPTAACTLTLPTGSDMTTAFAIGDGESFDWTIINLSVAAAADIITVTATTDHTLVGCMKVESQHSSTGAVSGSSSARFRSRHTTANTWITYRV